MSTSGIERQTPRPCDGDRWRGSKERAGRGVRARLGERILVALEIHPAAPFERRDYAVCDEEQDTEDSGSSHTNSDELFLGLRNRRRMSVAMPSFLLLSMIPLQTWVPHASSPENMWVQNKGGDRLISPFL